MEKQLNSLGLDYKICTTVDGRELPQQSIDSIYDKDAESRYWRSSEFDLRRYFHPFYPGLSQAEIGCALSHIKIWREIVENNIDKVLILEDDVELLKRKGELLSVLSNSNHFPFDWDIIFLGCEARKTFLQKARVPSELGFPVEFKRAIGLLEVFCTYAYIISNRCAKELLEITKTLHKPIDFYTGNHRQFNLYVVEPLLAVSQNKFETTIQERGVKKQTIEKYLWMKHYPWIKEYPKLFGLMLKWRPLRSVYRIKILARYYLSKLILKLGILLKF